jgi:hypothetical protein
MKSVLSMEDKAANVRRLFLLVAALVTVFSMSALAPSQAGAFINCSAPIIDAGPPPGGSPGGVDASPPDAGPPDAGLPLDIPDGPVCEPDPACDPETMSCPGAPEEVQIQIVTFSTSVQFSVTTPFG